MTRRGKQEVIKVVSLCINDGKKPHRGALAYSYDNAPVYFKMILKPDRLLNKHLENSKKYSSWNICFISGIYSVG